MDRRAFLTIAAGAAAVFASDWAGAPQWTPPLGVEEADGLDLVTSWEQRLPGLRRLESLHGGGATRAILAADLNATTQLLKAGILGPTDTVRLLNVIAEVGRITGWAHADAGMTAAAERFLIAAARSARAAGDRLSGANALKSLALLLIDNGRAGEAAQVMDIAARAADGSAGPVRAMLTVRRARAAAAAGDGTACARLLSRAETEMTVHATEPAPDWAGYFDEREFAAQVASCYLALGDDRPADRWLTIAVPPDGFTSRDTVTYGLWQAEAAARLGEVDRSCALLTRALPRLADASSTRNRARYAQARQALDRWPTHPLVREVDEQARDLIA